MRHKVLVVTIAAILLGFSYKVWAVVRADYIKVWVGVPWAIAGPVNGDFDMAVSTFTGGPGVRGYVGNSTTWRLDGPDAANLTYIRSPVIGPGVPGSFDDCGAWLAGVGQDTNPILGWYHAERNCNQNSHEWSVGFSSSIDGGITFSKPSNNQIISAQFSPSDSGFQLGAVR